MIGQLINTFESLPEQTVKTFNEIFKSSPILGYRDDQEVTIGELFCNVRQIFIDNKEDETFFHELRIVGEMEEISSRNGQGNCKSIRVYNAKKQFLGQYNSIKHAYMTLGYSQKQFSYAVSVGKLISEEVGTCN